MAEAAAKEPSMEDILSSIRKIIAEEGEADNEVHASAPVPSDVSPPPQVSDADLRPSIIAEEITKPEVHEEHAATHVPEVIMEAPTTEAVEAPDYSSTHSHVPVEQPAPEATANAGVSLASIAASLQQGNQSKTEQEPEGFAEPAAEEIHEEPQAEEPVMAVEETMSHNNEDLSVSHAEVVDHSSDVQMADATMPEPSRAPQVDVPSHGAETATADEEAFRGALMSPSADNAVTGSFDRLKRSAEDDMDAKTEAILRPMLREWLDENLPTLVEKLVREEIERVARGS